MILAVKLQAHSLNTGAAAQTTIVNLTSLTFWRQALRIPEKLKYQLSPVLFKDGHQVSVLVKVGSASGPDLSTGNYLF